MLRSCEWLNGVKDKLYSCQGSGKGERNRWTALCREISWLTECEDRLWKQTVWEKSGSPTYYEMLITLPFYTLALSLWNEYLWCGVVRKIKWGNTWKSEQYLLLGWGMGCVSLFCFLSLKLLALNLHSIPQKDKCRQVHDLNEEEDKIRHKRQVESFLTVLDLGM